MKASEIPERKRIRTPKESIVGGSPEALKRGIGTASYVSQKPKEFEESMLPTNVFAGSKKNKLGAGGQLKGNMKRAARSGDLVGGAAENINTHSPNVVKIGENWEHEINKLIKILESK